MKVLFVCLGNICRSPLAEGLFLHHVNNFGLNGLVEADSCGTGNWHEGELADPRMRKTAEKNGILLTHRARQIQLEDFDCFDLILVMDHQNHSDVVKLNPEYAYKVKLVSEFHESYAGQIIPDPYFGGQEGFDQVFTLLDHITKELVIYIQHTR